MAESENRINKRFDKLEQMIEKQNTKIDDLKDEIQKQIVDEKRYRHTNNIAIVLGVIATILTMVGIYYATISTISDMIGLISK